MKDKKNSKKYCFVPTCTNTALKAPNKLFVTVPKNEMLNKAWQKAVGRKNVKGTIFCCEDHFNVKTLLLY